ncbi:hypothetical protein J3Q64DRAFT_1702780 [Phycomyces blakesleeanus]|uniref:Uncharacterized protein n=2 Tax=Phycomyces blakesleeanus TaxID=4837 RepID=A0A162UBR2_PHYB8|nr:hypothetical protein PHYBLDRAFT_67805 [Phycomyces blakesleeanus NRRL 1555(-)]OAD75042.1 hypothetical protein PHYBLDRAFT_67805 [Phycomyces blakesleeanus NRRL 1555(-)]|eukprot:XP_018293082.1 hypothetical protein PHYBLDRAFT_67805 [Phycomyces blakesleeanus NRRL 1555(-)]
MSDRFKMYVSILFSKTSIIYILDSSSSTENYLYIDISHQYYQPNQNHKPDFRVIELSQARSGSLDAFRYPTTLIYASFDLGTVKEAVYNLAAKVDNMGQRKNTSLNQTTKGTNKRISYFFIVIMISTIVNFLITRGYKSRSNYTQETGSSSNIKFFEGDIISSDVIQNGICPYTPRSIIIDKDDMLILISSINTCVSSNSGRHKTRWLKVNGDFQESMCTFWFGTGIKTLLKYVIKGQAKKSGCFNVKRKVRKEYIYRNYNALPNRLPSNEILFRALEIR